MENVLLSVIMPCYNVGQTLARALDSILMQQSDFPYEIIVVDDCSTDDTLEVASCYAKVHENLIIIRNEENTGNAVSFYKGLCAARGDYFCVLDGDDYYTIPDKLQRQIDFFRDDVKDEYVACAHYYLFDLGDGKLYVPEFLGREEANYIDFLTEHYGYYHTSTYMYRNIFRGRVPEYFKERIYRGDTPRTTFHLMFSNKKTKILNFVGSAYCYTYRGIWTKMEVSEQYKYQLNYLNRHLEVVQSSFEKNRVRSRIQAYQNMIKASGSGQKAYDAISIEKCLEQVEILAGMYAASEREYLYRGLYYSEYLDSLCVSLGYMFRLYHPELVQDCSNEENICIVSDRLNACTENVFREILALSRLHEDKRLYVFAPNTGALTPDVEKAIDKMSNVQFVPAPLKGDERLNYYYARMKEIAPARTYYCTSADMAWAAALVQPGCKQNVLLFVLRQGFLLGVTNAMMHAIIARHPVDCLVLEKTFGSLVLYIPSLLTTGAKRSGADYVPFHGHETLITSSVSTPDSLLNKEGPNDYIDQILELLTKTKGKHVHFGLLSEGESSRVSAFLEQNGLSEDVFERVEKTENLGQELLDRCVDAFICSFPVAVPELTLEVMSVGIPVVSYDGLTRISRNDTIYEGCLQWRTREEFHSLLYGISAEKLREHSKLSQKYILDNHSAEAITPCLNGLYSQGTLRAQYIVDGLMHDIKNYFRLLGRSDARISVMPVKKDIKKTAKAEKTTVSRDIIGENALFLEDIRRIENSNTYRIGRAVVFIPKQILFFLHRNRYTDSKGKSLTLKQYEAQQKQNNPKLYRDNLYRSKAWTVGSAIVRPLKSIRNAKRR